MFRTIRHLLLTVIAAAAGSAALADDGAAIFQARCAACHGKQGSGNATLQAPPLAGHDEAYLARQLQSFRSGQRGGANPSAAVAGMQAVAKALPDDAAAAAVARYASKLKPSAIRASPAASGSPLMEGKATFSICMGCHGSGGEGNAQLGAPRLNHLPSWYIVAQLEAYRSDLRGTHADDRLGQQMRQLAKAAITDDGASRAVAEYIATLGTGRR